MPVLKLILFLKMFQIAGEKKNWNFCFQQILRTFKTFGADYFAGEMARVMLALKSILAEQDNIPVLIFDEIDSGIGGKLYRKYRKMMNLSKNTRLFR